MIGRRLVLCLHQFFDIEKSLCELEYLLMFQYLSNPDERLRWQANDLPTDDLCTENAIMLKRFNRYPLIIDPSGQATNFLLKEFKDKKITKTRSVSFVL